MQCCLTQFYKPNIFHTTEISCSFGQKSGLIQNLLPNYVSSLLLSPLPIHSDYYIYQPRTLVHIIPQWTRYRRAGPKLINAADLFKSILCLLLVRLEHSTLKIRVEQLNLSHQSRWLLANERNIRPFKNHHEYVSENGCALQRRENYCDHDKLHTIL